LVNGGLYLRSLAAGWGMATGMGRDSGWGYRYLPRWGWGLGLEIHGAVVVSRLQGEGLTVRRVDREIETLQRHDGSAAGTGTGTGPGTGPVSSSDGDRPAREALRPHRSPPASS
jgi:hypothetical protein